MGSTWFSIGSALADRRELRTASLLAESVCSQMAAVSKVCGKLVCRPLLLLLLLVHQAATAKSKLIQRTEVKPNVKNQVSTAATVCAFHPIFFTLLRFQVNSRTEEACLPSPFQPTCYPISRRTVGTPSVGVLENCTGPLLCSFPNSFI